MMDIKKFLIKVNGIECYSNNCRKQEPLSKVECECGMANGITHISVRCPRCHNLLASFSIPAYCDSIDWDNAIMTVRKIWGQGNKEPQNKVIISPQGDWQFLPVEKIKN